MSPFLWSDEQEKPIAHLRVVDTTLGTWAPLLTRILAQYGADVVKVEPLPSGDPLREERTTGLFDLLNAGKRSCAIDYSRPEGAALLKELAADADVFVEAFPDGRLEAAGLGYAALSEANPDLIYLSLRVFSGKRDGETGGERTAVASSGCGEWLLETGANGAAPVAETLGTLLSALRLMMHLANPARRGMHLVGSLDEAFRTLWLGRAFDALRADGAPSERKAAIGAHRRRDGSRPHSRFYRCRDGQSVALEASTPEAWEAFCDAVDRAAWKPRADDPTLVAEVEKMFLDAPSTYWETITRERHTTLTRVVPWDEHWATTPVRAQLASDPLTWLGLPATRSLTPAPALGSDTTAVLHGLGLTNRDLATAFQLGILQQPLGG